MQNASVGLDETETVVTCELCQKQTSNFNKHMRTAHPGCGGKYFCHSLEGNSYSYTCTEYNNFFVAHNFGVPIALKFKLSHVWSAPLEIGVI